MDFVEAVRLGCEKTTKVRGLFHFSNREITGACVLGAAFLGAELQIGNNLEFIGTSEVASKLREMFPVLNAASMPCPAERCGCMMLMTPTVLAVHLNDFHRWDRISIAEYIQNL